jgi:hypothetical protein
LQPGRLMLQPRRRGAATARGGATSRASDMSRHARACRAACWACRHARRR